MITSDKQLVSAKEKLGHLSYSLSCPIKNNVPNVIANAGREQIKELFSEIQSDIDEYEQLKTMRPEDIEIHSLDDLMVVPIRYRIASRMSVDEFSRKVGISARQIMRYESDKYQNITSNTFQKVLNAINIHLEGKVA